MNISGILCAERRTYTEVPAITAIETFPIISASRISAPPEWALLQRRLIEVNESNAALMIEKHCAPGGMMYYADDIDDYYEKVYNWGLLYAMGGSRQVFDDAQMVWNATTRTNGDEGNPVYSWMLPQLHNEYYAMGRQDESTWVPGRRMVNEWHHQSEGNMAFYGFGLADPSIPENVRRARRFANMYIGEDPDAPNWDADHKIIRSPFPTSRGPVFEITTANVVGFLHGSAATYTDDRYLFKKMGTMGTIYPVVKDVEDGWWKDPKRARQITDVFNKVVLNGDIANNLASTALVTNAYMYTGEEKYKQWVLDYVEVWMDRIKKNGGIIPDNVGPTGKIGENRDGQWWGGLFGWSYYMGLNIMFHGLVIASECAQMLTGDSGYLDLLRSQLEVVIENAIEGDDGQLLIRYRHDHRGWVDDNEYGHLGAQPMRGKDIAHLYHASMSDKDFQLFTHLRDGEVRRDWNDLLGNGEKDHGDAEFARFQYYDGKNPDWPTKILRKELNASIEGNQRLREENRTPQELVDQQAHPLNAVVTKGLTQVMLGSPQSIYNGGLLRATVRYYDAAAKRPGLPPDVAAFVDELRPDGAGLQLVNLSPSETRSVIVQAGAFGEHQITEVTWQDGESTAGKTVNGKYVTVKLPPSTNIRLDIKMRRFINQPTYAFPWHGDKIPVAFE